MWIKTKKKHKSRHYYYRLNHSKREGAKVKSFSLYLGRTLALSAEEWLAKLASARGFQPKVREVLPVVERYIHKHFLSEDWLDGLREAMRVECSFALPALRRLNASPYHLILGVGAGATKTEIRSAFRRLARKFHPDRGGDPAKFRELVAAFEALVPPKTVDPTSGLRGAKKSEN